MPMPSDKDMLDFLEQESLNLRCHDAPTGGGDADVMWRVIGHYMAAPKERQIGKTEGNPRAAIASAMKAQERGLAAIAAGK